MSEDRSTPDVVQADELGLSIDMLDVDRLREWARLLLVHGADIGHWGSVTHVAGKLQLIATSVEKAIRDIGTLRAQLSTLTQRVETLAEIVKVKNSELDAMRGARDAQREQREAAERQVTSLTAEIAQLRTLTTWQLIETAPKDHDGILLSDGVNVSQGGWLSQVDQGAEYEGQSGAPSAGWWSVDCIEKPTHWQSLPSPPLPHAAPREETP